MWCVVLVVGQVESDTGKVKRLKKDCLNCGAGVRMAVHYDRYYCGKCALTYIFKKDGETA